MENFDSVLNESLELINELKGALSDELEVIKRNCVCGNLIKQGPPPVLNETLQEHRESWLNLAQKIHERLHDDSAPPEQTKIAVEELVADIESHIDHVLEDSAVPDSSSVASISPETSIEPTSTSDSEN